MPCIHIKFLWKKRCALRTYKLLIFHKKLISILSMKRFYKVLVSGSCVVLVLNLEMMINSGLRVYTAQSVNTSFAQIQNIVACHLP